MLLIDEFAESLRLLLPGDRERLLDKVQVLGYSGRKYDVACVLLAQSWLTGAISSSQVRNPLRAAVAMRADEGRALTGLRAEAWPADPSTLEPGETYVLGVGASGLVRVRVPLLESPTRVRPQPLPPTSTVLPATSAPLPSAAIGSNDGSGWEVEPEVAAEVTSALPDKLPEREVRRLLRLNYSPSRVVRELTGLDGGRHYQRLTQGLSRWLVARALGGED